WAARAGRRAAARFPVVVPEHRAVARVDREHVVGGRRVQLAVDHQNAAAEAGGSAAVRVAVAEAARDDRIVGPAAGAGAAPATAAASASAARGCRPGPARLTGAVRSTSLVERCDPLQTQILDRVLVDELQRAVALAGEIAGVTRPFVRERLVDPRLIEPAGVWRRRAGLNRLASPFRIAG